MKAPRGPREPSVTNEPITEEAQATGCELIDLDTMIQQSIENNEINPDKIAAYILAKIAKIMTIQTPNDADFIHAAVEQLGQVLQQSPEWAEFARSLSEYRSSVHTATLGMQESLAADQAQEPKVSLFKRILREIPGLSMLLWKEQRAAHSRSMGVLKQMHDIFMNTVGVREQVIANLSKLMDFSSDTIERFARGSHPLIIEQELVDARRKMISLVPRE
jgi:hypothetical protein